MIEGYALSKGGSSDVEKATELLVKQVISLMEKGWTPQGGVTHVAVGAGVYTQHIFTQAMVKHGAPNAN